MSDDVQLERAKPTGLATTTPFSGLFAPSTRQEAMELCDRISKESWVSQCYRGNPMFVAIALDYASRFKIHVLAALNGIAVINGKPTIFGDLLLAVCRSVFPSMRMKQEYYRDLKLPELKGVGCRVTVSRPHTDGSFEEYTECFGEEQARKAGLWGKKGPWTDYPERMCMFRARSYALRAAFPEVLSGYMSVEEAQEVREVHMTGRPRRHETILMPPREESAEQDEAESNEPVHDLNGVVQEDDVPQHNLQEVLHAFGMAVSQKELDQVAQAAATLQGSEADQAREAYRKRRAEIQNTSAGDRVLSKVRHEETPEPIDA